MSCRLIRCHFFVSVFPFSIKTQFSNSWTTSKDKETIIVPNTLSGFRLRMQSVGRRFWAALLFPLFPALSLSFSLLLCIYQHFSSKHHNNIKCNDLSRNNTIVRCTKHYDYALWEFSPVVIVRFTCLFGLICFDFRFSARVLNDEQTYSLLWLLLFFLFCFVVDSSFYLSGNFVRTFMKKLCHAFTQMNRRMQTNCQMKH